MTRNRLVSAIILVGLILSMVVQVSAEPVRSYFNGCSQCKSTVTAYCHLVLSATSRTHQYGGFLWINPKTCTYTEHCHSTTEHCQANPSHVNPGDNVYAYTGHEKNSNGSFVCGEVDIQPCSPGSVAYIGG